MPGLQQDPVRLASADVDQVSAVSGVDGRAGADSASGAARDGRWASAAVNPLYSYADEPAIDVTDQRESRAPAAAQRAGIELPGQMAASLGQAPAGETTAVLVPILCCTTPTPRRGAVVLTPWWSCKRILFKLCRSDVTKCRACVGGEGAQLRHKRDLVVSTDRGSLASHPLDAAEWSSAAVALRLPGDALPADPVKAVRLRPCQRMNLHLMLSRCVAQASPPLCDHIASHPS